MRAAVPAPAANERSPKPTPTAEKRLTLLREVAQYYRRDLGLSRLDADLLVRLATRHRAVAVATLPERLADDLTPHPARFIVALEHMSEAGNVGRDRTPTFTRRAHEDYQRAVRARRRAAARAHITAHVECQGAVA
ncbi:hypothetical protein [Micrococcus luteus]|uniref:hypothetical protein n=1 Tax=Micrococcus luteus TaxID=1270 RepID=UPI0011DCB3F8|nr:hypothetical protein [Micrococcus luteus]